jgi:leader peptidase (prepilin peptidase)/N-methyltransferase
MLEAALAFLAGLVVGSFLNVCIHRMPRDLSVVRPRSFCPSCKRPIAWHDNLPVLSYLILRGRCRHCQSHIPFRYPVVEILTAVLFSGIVLPLGTGLLSIKLCLFSALLVGLIFSDLEQRILPDEFTVGGIAAGVLLAALLPMEWGFAHLLLPSGWGERWLSVSESAVGACSASALLWVVGALFAKIRHREGLGFGDVKMVAMIGAFLGLHRALQTLILASILGSVIGLIYIRLTRKDASTYELPFGAFLGVTALAVALAGGPVITWYLRLAE